MTIAPVLSYHFVFGPYFLKNRNTSCRRKSPMLHGFPEATLYLSKIKYCSLLILMKTCLDE